MYESQDILRILPHRHPFLFLDRVTAIEPGRRAEGIKNVTLSEAVFAGHFPDRPIMPGVLIVEALAQLGAVALLCEKANQGKIPVFTGIDGARFKKPVRPGDQLRLEASIVRRRGRLGKAEARAFVGSDVVAEAQIMFALLDEEDLE